jgi:hypothetical protein
MKAVIVPIVVLKLDTKAVVVPKAVVVALFVAIVVLKLDTKAVVVL